MWVADKDNIENDEVEINISGKYESECNINKAYQK